MECIKNIVYVCFLLAINISASRPSVTEEECIPLVDCPFSMNLIMGSQKYEPTTIAFLRNSHCGHSKEKGPLTWCPNMDFCITPDGINGTCGLLSQCDNLLKSISNGIEFNKYRCNPRMKTAMYICCPKLLPPATEISKTQNSIPHGLSLGPPPVIDKIQNSTLQEFSEKTGKSNPGSSKESERIPYQSSCLTPDGKNGTCEAMIHCPDLMRSISTTNELEKYKCNPHVSNEIYICCPKLPGFSLHPPPININTTTPNTTKTTMKYRLQEVTEPMSNKLSRYYLQTYPMIQIRKLVQNSRHTNIVPHRREKKNAIFEDIDIEDKIAKKHQSPNQNPANIRLWPFRRPQRKPDRYDYPGSYEHRWPYYHDGPIWHKDNENSYNKSVSYDKDDDYNNNNKYDNHNNDYDNYNNKANNFDNDVYLLKSADYPENYRPNKRNHRWSTCGRCSRFESQRIIGGTLVGLGEYPWMALIQYKGINRITNGCGGTLVSSRYILTAAHCVDDLILRARKLKLYRIILGEYDINNDPDCTTSFYRVCSDPVRKYEASRITKHEQFDNIQALHDIALIKLDREVIFSDYIKPVCLPFKDFVMVPNELVIVAGWGRIATGGRYSPILKKASLPYVSQDICNSRGVSLIAGQMCLGLGNGVDTCTGDSGGPMMMQKLENGELVTYQVGIISYGFATDECGKAPSVNTYLPYYVDWINSKIG